MNKTHTKVIKGLSIASIAVSAFLAACCGILQILFGLVTSMAQDYAGSSVYNNGGYGLSHHNSFGYGDIYSPYGSYGGYYDISDADALEMLTALSGPMNALIVIGFIMLAFCVAAGIVCLRNSSDPNRLGVIFGWSLAAAIVGFLCSGLILAVLNVLICVFAYQDKKLYRTQPWLFSDTPSVPVARPAAPAPVPPSAPIATAEPQQEASSEEASSESTGQASDVRLSFGEISFDMPAEPAPQQNPSVEAVAEVQQTVVEDEVVETAPDSKDEQGL